MMRHFNLKWGVSLLLCIFKRLAISLSCHSVPFPQLSCFLPCWQKLETSSLGKGPPHALITSSNSVVFVYFIVCVLLNVPLPQLVCFPLHWQQLENGSVREAHALMSCPPCNYDVLRVVFWDSSFVAYEACCHPSSLCLQEKLRQLKAPLCVCGVQAKTSQRLFCHSIYCDNLLTNFWSMSS